MPSDDTLDLQDIQGLVLRGYGTLRAARFVMLEIVDEPKARAYLHALAPSCAYDPPKDTALQVAITAKALEVLGVPKRARDSFSREFNEGMDQKVRSDALGDRGANDPEHWAWGRTGEPVHVLLMLYADGETRLKQLVKDELGSEAPAGLILGGAFRVLHDKHTNMLDGQKEHFGWTDGLSMPVIAGVPPDRPRKQPKKHEQKVQETWTDPLPPGEFVLGYRNDYKAFSECPVIDPDEDPANALPMDPDGIHKSLGRNGTYLVYREITQHVHTLWNYLAGESREDGHDEVARATALGAKMVGRWPGGAPLVTSPKHDDRDHATDNAFVYDKRLPNNDEAADNDKVGLRCPAGAHIRRANPRDVLAPDRDPDVSLQMVRKHQMIRRGRPFGPPVSDKLHPKDLVAARGLPETGERGLHFICLVGDIRRQFEFVQRAWVDSPVFYALSRDGDPISAARRAGDNRNDEFTCPADPVRRKYKHMPQFTQLVGGGYFFLPGITALKFITRPV